MTYKVMSYKMTNKVSYLKIFSCFIYTRVITTSHKIEFVVYTFLSAK